MTAIETRSLEQLLELIGGDESALQELIETFIEEGKEITDAMKASLITSNLDELNRGAHSMKSSAQDFGAITLSELNATLESQCKNGWPENAKSQTVEIAQQFEVARAELQHYIENKL